MKNIWRTLVSLIFSSAWLQTMSDKNCNYHKHTRDKSFEGTMYRLGKTRFFIHFSRKPHDLQKGIYGFQKMDWVKWKGQCSLFHSDARLPFPEKVSTNALIARNLEVTIEKNNITFYSYWIGARSYGSGSAGVFVWEKMNEHSNGVQIRYSNVFYTAPRIIGENKLNVYNTKGIVNASEETAIDYEHTYKFDNFRSELCMAFGLPFKNHPDFGYQTSWIERHCGRDTSAICEIDLPECNEMNLNLNPHVLTEDKEYYYTEGNWLFANRRFIVNWKPRNWWEAKAYCKQWNLKLFSPTLDDLCLIPYLKMWGMVINTYHFWTSYLYDAHEQTFMTEDGTVIQRGAKVANMYLQSRSSFYMSGKVAKVSYIWTYERMNETRCKDLHCKWMYYVLAPIYENMYLGTICQHAKEDNLRTCDFDVSWNSDFTQALGPTAVVEFGYKGSGFYRSNYKQTFGSRECGHSDRQMVRVDTDYWSVNPADVEFVYDYEETYWVVDTSEFEHVGKHEPLCTVSTVKREGDKFKRELSKVNCDEWHFYLCEFVY